MCLHPLDKPKTLRNFKTPFFMEKLPSEKSVGTINHPPPLGLKGEHFLLCTKTLHTTRVGSGFMPEGIKILTAVLSVFLVSLFGILFVTLSLRFCKNLEIKLNKVKCISFIPTCNPLKILIYAWRIPQL